MLCTYFTSYRVVSLRAAWVTFDAPGWLDRDPYGIFTVIIIIINLNLYGAKIMKYCKALDNIQLQLVNKHLSKVGTSEDNAQG